MIGSPKALACEKFASEAWARFQDVPGLKYPNLKFIQGSVSSIDFKAKVAHIVDADSKDSCTESYDYLIAGSGLRRTFPTVPQSLRREEFLKEATEHMSDVKNAREGVVVVGGGMRYNNIIQDWFAPRLTSYHQVLWVWKWPPN